MISPVIKWSGSKRSQAKIIKSFLPNKFDCYYEPFIGGGSMLYAINPSVAICGDICKPLIDFWNSIKLTPDVISESYNRDWHRLQKEGFQVFYEIRDRFNNLQTPEDLLFLSRTCVNGLIRFNSDGKFNNSFHHTRPGISPDKLAKIVEDWSKRIQQTTFLAQNYIETTQSAKKGDLVYLDPPYFHTKGRYYGTIDYDQFIAYLENLNSRGVMFILSYDGVRGTDNFTVDIPKELFKRHEYISSGNSSFKKVMDKQKIEVSESLYLNW